ncbi:non-specific lipid-transfer protein 2-like [Rhododendron vialii]|uniref:non-specific lipid-transfer protein 2-like n=1 Tax=Rhododendron vialii TaxID=182163 RepID=UPI00265E3EF6|nr:non-specific lipid-transfer protein 2-like [Rhododendron vialii]
MKASNIGVFIVLVLVLGCYKPKVSMAATCKILSLSPCLDAITSGTTPSDRCCSRLKEQEACLCEFAKDPDYSQYITSPNAMKVATACGVAIPTC